MMPFTPETGSNIILEWYRDIKCKTDDSLVLFSDSKNGKQAVFGLKEENLEVCSIRLFNGELRTDTKSISRDNQLTLFPVSFGEMSEPDFKGGKFLSTVQYLSYHYSLKNFDSKPRIIVNCWGQNYFILGVNEKNEIVYANGISTDRIEEVYYLIAASKECFFLDLPNILIESEHNEFEAMHKFLSKYFNSIHHIYSSLKEQCVGLNKENLADFNCALLNTYINHR